MALHIFDNSAQGAYFVLLVVLAPICIAATILRFIATRRSGRAPALEDWFALAALIVHLAYTVLSLWVLIEINGRDTVVMAVREPEEFAYLRKMYFSKLSIMALYHRIFGVNRTYVWWIYGIFAIHSIWAIVTIVIQLSSCRPLAKFWYPFTPGYCWSASVAAIPEETVNSGVDFALVILAIFMIRSLQMSRRVKRKLRFLFGLGSMWVP
ncbi:hypothetical protein DL768_006464 [Monosporascus sp. mg162]|nr:hypothetical protein DL768_006464 [Monosporascus sp. mg162]